MDMLATIGAYVETFRRLATQLNGREVAGRWFRMGIPAETAAEWANAGFLPGEARELIGLHIRPEQVAHLDAAGIARLIRGMRIRTKAQSDVLQAPLREQGLI